LLEASNAGFSARWVAAVITLSNECGKLQVIQLLEVIARMNREYHKWYSHRLGRDMELLIFGHGGAKALVFPTRCGRFHEYENMGLVEALRHKIEHGHLQLYCVDGIDEESFYCWWSRPWDRVHRHLQYETYLLDEVLPLMWTKNAHPCVISHGCSFGAFHAVNFAFRHPQVFNSILKFLSLDSEPFCWTQGPP